MLVPGTETNFHSYGTFICTDFYKAVSCFASCNLYGLCNFAFEAEELEFE